MPTGRRVCPSGCTACGTAWPANQRQKAALRRHRDLARARAQDGDGTVAIYLRRPFTDLWSLRTRIAVQAFGPVKQWPDLRENLQLLEVLQREERSRARETG